MKIVSFIKLEKSMNRVGKNMINKDLQAKLEIIAKHYGYSEQCQQTNEEMAELTVALSKYRRYGKLQHDTRLANIVTEIADVTIMLKQLAYLLECDKEVEKEIEYKINRALRRISKEK
jgi:NTP pyrophosphatase (non-canonical NTP hydrolase)